jgi:hypothetical protein
MRIKNSNTVSDAASKATRIGTLLEHIGPLLPDIGNKLRALDYPVETPLILSINQKMSFS